MFDAAGRCGGEPAIDAAPSPAPLRPLLRLWLARIRPGRESAYRAFADGVFRPTYNAHAGCLDVSFLALDGRVNGVITQWRSADDVVALQLSPRYQDTMARVLSEGLLEAVAPVALWPIPTDVARRSRALALRVHRAMENLPATH